jgi:hypothetical protein
MWETSGVWKESEMKFWIALLCVLATASAMGTVETLFVDGEHEFEGQRYYLLSRWDLEVTLPPDIAPGDRFEVLFGTKGPNKRRLYYEYEGRSGALVDFRQQPYTWIEVPLGKLTAGKRVLLFSKDIHEVAFLAGVRVSGQSTAALAVKPTRSTPVWANLPGFEMNDASRRLWEATPGKPDWERARRSAQYAGIALDKVQRWLHECVLPLRDDGSGLFRPASAQWTYRDTAADCYPFYVWAAFYTDQEVLDTVMVDVLQAEQRLCNHLDRIPVRYDMDRGEKLATDMDSMVFGASEYVKDGLLPIVEITGREAPWFERMRGIVDDLFKHARIDTPYGKIPSTNLEVNGELLQILPRLYSITDDRKYLDWAHRLADHYLKQGDFIPKKLSDHGCEIIGGLGLLLAVDSTASPDKFEEYKAPFTYMCDEIILRGTNSDGIIVAELHPTPGPHDNALIRDGWGYDYVGFLDYDQATGEARFRNQIESALGSLLKPRYLNFNWDHYSRDNIADSVEGALYLLRRIPVPQAFVWADREIATCLVNHADLNRLWGTHKLEANTVRTVLIHTMLHTRNTIARPWRQGLRLGAAPCGDGICVFMESNKVYEGRLQFDVPRHRITMGFQQDWPRMNAVPEWFTVEPDNAHVYDVENVDGGGRRVISGKSLSEGLPIRLEPGKPLRVVVSPQSQLE